MRNRNESDLNYVEYALRNILKIKEETQRFPRLGLSFNDEAYIDLMSFYIAQIGEMFGGDKISEKLLRKFDIDARLQSNIYGTRVYVNHHYSNNDPKETMKTLQNDIPMLEQKLLAMRRYLLSILEE